MPSTGERVNDLVTQHFKGELQRGLDAFAGEVRKRLQKVLNRVARGQLLQDEFDGNAGAGNSGLASQDLRVTDDSCIHLDVFDRVP